MMDEIKPGDVFEVRVKVAEIRGSRCVISAATTGYSEVERFILLAGRRVARPLGVGDRVKTPIRYGTGVILGIYAAMAWTLWEGRDFQTGALADLERAPAPDTKEGT